MNSTKKYGVVYTPRRLADFVAALIKIEADKDNYIVETVLDPACGEGALLRAAERQISCCKKFYGIDVDKEVIANLSSKVSESTILIANDAIMPNKIRTKTSNYWKKRLSKISAIIANPPWSSEKIYDRNELAQSGFKFHNGQYDSYVLFMELAYEILDEGGYLGFIIPDSLFDSQNELLRQFLAEKTQIRVIARLGEKIFEEVNRATTVVICKKSKPKDSDLSMCFRLNTEDRKQFLSSDIELDYFYEKLKHPVRQLRFQMNEYFNFDIDTYEDEEQLLNKIKKDCINWNQTFMFGRGVEISKKGEIAMCPECGHAQGYTKAQFNEGKKTCTGCNNELYLNSSSLKNIIHHNPGPRRERILVGENVKRYSLEGENYIELDVPGINYKNKELYNPPKILIRKTGLGIYASVDYSGGMTIQTVYLVRYKNENGAPPLEYYLGILNSRVVYYYYLKMYGENEWKSHPYLTKKIIFSLPLKAFNGDDLDYKIAKLGKELSQRYSYQKDMELEKLVMERYSLTSEERNMIFVEMNKLPNLSAINGMKFKGESWT